MGKCDFEKGEGRGWWSFVIVFLYSIYLVVNLKRVVSPMMQANEPRERKILYWRERNDRTEKGESFQS